MAARYVEVSLDGQTWRMPVNYRAAMQIARTVGDPLQMVQKAARGQLNWSMSDVVQIIQAGLAAAGCGLSQDEIGEQVIAAGINSYIMPASAYVSSLVSGGPEHPVDTAKKA